VRLFQIAWASSGDQILPDQAANGPAFAKPTAWQATNGREHEKKATADDHGCTQIKHRKTGEHVLEKSICVYLQPARHSFSDGWLIRGGT
jgi:hypothetical protein